MEFEDACCLDDLIVCNILYIQGVLDKTPIRNAPMEEECEDIADKLVELGDNGVLTIAAQPACVLNGWRQRGFVTGAIECDLDGFVDLLNETNLTYIVQQNGR